MSYQHDQEVTANVERAEESIKAAKDLIKGTYYDFAAVGLEYVEGGDPLQPASPINAWIVHFGDYSSNNISITVGVAK
jgi:hypothetical protein